MPHIPRRYPSSLGMPQELTAGAKAHAPIPVQKKTDDGADALRKHFGLKKLSLKDYEPDFKQVCKTMFGKEPETDEYTGRLVLAKPHPALAAAFGAK